MLSTAAYPSRCRAGSTFVLPTREQIFDYIERDWGSGASLARFAPSRVNDVGLAGPFRSETGTYAPQQTTRTNRSDLLNHIVGAGA